MTRTTGVTLSILAVVALAGVTAEDGLAAKQKRRAVSMTLHPVSSYRSKQGEGRTDTFRAVGTPFGTVTINADTPESDLQEDFKHVRFALFPFRKHYVAHGVLAIHTRYLKTTSSYQTTSYKGTGTFALEPEDNETINYYSGLITSFAGVSTCYYRSGRCTGTIVMKGTIKY